MSDGDTSSSAEAWLRLRFGLMVSNPSTLLRNASFCLMPSPVMFFIVNSALGDDWIGIFTRKRVTGDGRSGGFNQGNCLALGRLSWQPSVEFWPSITSISMRDLKNINYIKISSCYWIKFDLKWQRIHLIDLLFNWNLKLMPRSIEILFSAQEVWYAHKDFFVINEK